MSVYTHVSGGAGETLVFPIRDVFVCLRVDVLFGQAKVDDVYYILVGSRVAPEEEVLWLNVTVYQVFAVHILNSCDLNGGRGQLVISLSLRFVYTMSGMVSTAYYHKV